MSLPIKAVSSCPSRTRIRILGLTDDENDRFDQVADKMASCNLIEGLRTNFKARSILFFHDDSEEKILSYGFKKGLIHWESEEEARIPPPGKRQPTALPRTRSQLRRRIKQLDCLIQDYTDGEYDLQSASAVALLGMSIYQTFTRHRFLPAGEVLLVNGLSKLVDKTERMEEMISQLSS